MVMKFPADRPDYGALDRPCGSRPGAFGGCGPPPSSDGTIAKVNTVITEYRETANPQAACGPLRDGEHRPHPAAGNGPIAIAHCDTEGRYTFVNRNYAERRGLTPEQVVGKRIPEVVGEKAWAIFEPYVRKCLAGNTIECELEIDLPYRPGEPQFVHCYYEPEWRDDKVVGLIAAITNITSLKRAEAALRESEVTFRVMFDASSVGKIEVDPESKRFLRVNAAMCEFVGYTEAELLARTVVEITHPDDRDHGRELSQRLVAGEADVFDL